jgi:hypothetical protein
MKWPSVIHVPIQGIPSTSGHPLRARCTALKNLPELPVFPLMAVLRPAAALSKSFLIAT